MNAQIKQQWINDLRSGNYNQTIGQLMEEDEDGTRAFCCLGVLTDQYLKANNKGWDDNMENSNYKYRSEGILPCEVKEWAGLYERDPTIIDDGYLQCLSTINDDRGWDFNQISDVIEKSNFEPE